LTLQKPAELKTGAAGPWLFFPNVRISAHSSHLLARGGKTMNTIIRRLENFSTLLVILGAILAVLGIAGRVKTKWGDINFSPKSKRLPVFGVAVIFIGLAAFLELRPASPKPPTIEQMALQDDGKFEWQWAGQNWIGNARFGRDSNNEITLSLDVNKVLGTEAVADVMRTSQPGKVKISNGSMDITDVKVIMNGFELVPIGSDRYMEGVSKKNTSTKIISITNLRPVIAFAGSINYQHRDVGDGDRIVNEGTGDIVLVKHSSGRRF